MTMKRISATLCALLLVAAGTAIGAETLWLNVHVTEHTDGTNVEVHLPLDLVLTVIRNVDVENFHAGMVDLEIDDVDVNWSEIMKGLRDAPDGEFVKVDAPDANVLIRKEAGTIRIDVTETSEDNAKVKVTVPSTMIDALIVDEENRIDVAALLQSFEQLPDGDLVTVEAEDANVRVWIE
jgi:hypothetical protein